MKEALMERLEDLAAFLLAPRLIPILKGTVPIELTPRLLDGIGAFFMLMLMSPMFERELDIMPA